MSRTVVLVDAVRTPFGKSGGAFVNTRADDLLIRAMRGLIERNPTLPLNQIDDVAIAAATQTGDQGMNIGRSASLLAGLPNTVPGYSIDRWCAGALTATTTVAGQIAMGAMWCSWPNVHCASVSCRHVLDCSRIYIRVS